MLTIMEFMSQLGVFWQVLSNTAIPSSPGMPLAASSSPHFAQNGFITALQPLEHWSVAVGYPPEHPAVPAKKSPGSAFCADPVRSAAENAQLCVRDWHGLVTIII
jgi:hypothetical protein